ncbi:MAG: hypothetical protein KA764_22640 [Anaerolineales bacterium]|nr:hypothetical protein [Anaerolineales bacterium]
MKNTLILAPLFIVAALACGRPLTPTTPAEIPASATPISATEAPTAPSTEALPIAPPTALPASFQGTAVSFGTVSLVLPPALAIGVRGHEFARVAGDDAAWWQKTPGHIQLDLEGYLLQHKSHQPQIFVYPAQAYAELVPAAFESLRRLDNLLYGPSAPLGLEQLPAAPFFNDVQAFAANIQVIAFQNGSGARFLTQSAQYAAPANNHELFYHFEGVTRDGADYIIAIFPITAPVLAETSAGGAVLPPGGIPYPDITDPGADWPGYYSAVTALLNTTSPAAFVPPISQLDLLIQSLRITP